MYTKVDQTSVGRLACNLASDAQSFLDWSEIDSHFSFLVLRHDKHILLTLQALLYLFVYIDTEILCNAFVPELV